MSPRTFALALTAALVAGVAAHLWRGYGVELAVVTGIAVGLLVFATQRTIERLRQAGRRGGG